MRILFAILSVVICLWAECHHNSIRQYAEINIPLYMRSKGLMFLFAILGFIIVALDFVAMFDIGWYWCVLISIPVHLVLFALFTLFYEKVTNITWKYVSGGSAVPIWIKMFIAMAFSIVAVIL